MLFILCICGSSLLNALTLKEKIVHGNIGDYIVTQQQGIYTVLLIRDLNTSHLILEEITLSEMEDVSNMTWKEWVEKKAPGHHSWTAYQIDLNRDKLTECFSYAQGSWLFIDDPNHFMAKLLSLSLERTPNDARKRIGPPPMDEETDHRSFWRPPVIVEGGKRENISLIAWSGKWPQDQTLLSGCEVEFYFSDFSFPYWIEVKTPHYQAPLRAIDSGSHLASPMPPLPERPPVFLGPAVWKGKNIELKLQSPLYYTQLNLFAIDVSDEVHPTIAVSSTMTRVEEEVTLQISEITLQTTLQKGHRYRWVVVPENTTHVLGESDYIFMYGGSCKTPIFAQPPPFLTGF